MCVSLNIILISLFILRIESELSRLYDEYNDQSDSIYYIYLFNEI